MFWGWEGSPSPRAPKSLFPRVPSEPREGPRGSSTLVGPGYSESEHSGVFPRTPLPPLAASDLGRRSGVGGREEAKQRDAWTAWTATEEEQLWPPLGSSRARAERARARLADPGAGRSCEPGRAERAAGGASGGRCASGRRAASPPASARPPLPGARGPSAGPAAWRTDAHLPLCVLCRFGEASRQPLPPRPRGLAGPRLEVPEPLGPRG